MLVSFMACEGNHQPYTDQLNQLIIIIQMAVIPLAHCSRYENPSLILLYKPYSFTGCITEATACPRHNKPIS